jgi:hypothetical protein
MPSLLDTLSKLERQAHHRWLANASHQHFGRCDSCGRTRNDQGRPLYVARQERSRKFECFDCWEFGPGPKPTNRSEVAAP